MKLLLDEGQVGVIKPGDNPSVQIFNSVANGFHPTTNEEVSVMVPIDGLTPPKAGEVPVVGFPNVNSCQGVLCVLKDGTMVGTHVPQASDEGRLLQKMKEIIDQNGSGIASMYVASRNRSQTQETGGTPQEKARMLGYTGKLRTFDTGVASKQDQGIYVEFTPVGKQGQGQCLVEYKKDKKMHYEKETLSTTDPKNRVRTAVAKYESRLHDDSDATKLHKASVKTRKV